MPRHAVRHTMACVLAGDRGSRLMELTDERAKPAVFFGGKSRIIDFTLSNALNSGIRHISVAAQHKAHSLIPHLQRGWTSLAPLSTIWRHRRRDLWDYPHSHGGVCAGGARSCRIENGWRLTEAR